MATEWKILCYAQIVDDVPMHLSPEGQSTHSIYIPDENIRLPLKLHGCLSYLPTCLPIQEEIENKMWLILTNEIEWDPYASRFEENEEWQSRIILHLTKNKIFMACTVAEIVLYQQFCHPYQVHSSQRCSTRSQ